MIPVYRTPFLNDYLTNFNLCSSLCRRRGRLRQTAVVEDEKVVAVGPVHETGPATRVVRADERERGSGTMSRARPGRARARQFRGLLQQPDQLRDADVGLDEHEPGVDADRDVERGGGRGGAAMPREAEDQGEGEDQVQGLRQRRQPGVYLHVVVRVHVDVHVHVRVRLGPVERQLQPARAQKTFHQRRSAGRSDRRRARPVQQEQTSLRQEIGEGRQS